MYNNKKIKNKIELGFIAIAQPIKKYPINFRWVTFLSEKHIPKKPIATLIKSGVPLYPKFQIIGFNTTDK